MDVGGLAMLALGAIGRKLKTAIGSTSGSKVVYSTAEITIIICIKLIILPATCLEASTTPTLRTTRDRCLAASGPGGVRQLLRGHLLAADTYRR